MALEAIKNEVMRKIGRNMLLFQQMEHMLKFLIVHGNFAGSVDEVREEQEALTAAVRNQSMGKLVRLFLKGGQPSTPANALVEASPPAATISFAMQYSGQVGAGRKTLKAIVDERNDLVHHLLPRLDPNSVDSWMDADRYLDQQREKLLPEIVTLERAIDLVERGRKEFAELLTSDETRRQFKSWIRHSRLVILLNEVSAQVARPDGWTMLNIAGQFIRQHAPDVMATLKGDDGHKTLKRLILATELFDIAEEPTEKGVRILYRMKQGWTLQDS